VVRFKWIGWNLDKIAAHSLSPEEVEHAYVHRIGLHKERQDGSYETVGRTAAGRMILIVWRYDEEFDAFEEEQVVSVVFVITAY